MSQIKIKVGNRDITLTDKNYKAQGGEGTVYIKDNAVYKINHDPKTVLSEKKIQELQALAHIPNIIIPNTSIFDTAGQRIGYVMRFVDDTEHLCKLFVNNFKQDNNITPEMVVALVKKMQETLLDIHKTGIVVGDYNEMNFLVDDKFAIPYHIDTDSYQTPNFKCTAIMDSVRDRKFPFGTFNTESDWFSWAIVTFQLYTGIHPFKGKHPNYKPNDFDGRMKDGVSVFHKDVTVPKFVNLAAIPQKHMDWYKNVFTSADRNPPPFADGIGYVVVARNVYTDVKSQIEAVLFFTYDNKIIHAQYHNLSTWVITRNGIWRDKSKVTDFATELTKKAMLGFADNVPVLIVAQKHEIEFYDQHKNLIGTYQTNDAMACNGCVYSVSEAGIVEHSFMDFGKTKVMHKVVSTALPLTTKMYDGVAVQDLYGKITLGIPYAVGMFVNTKVPELDGYKIMDAKRIGHVCMVLGEKGGKYDCVTILLDKTYYKNYISSIDYDVEYRSINFTMKENGLVVKVEDDNNIKMFVNFDKIHVFPGTPVDIDFRVFGSGNIQFVNHDKVYTARTK
jgi:hypothetical protein